MDLHRTLPRGAWQPHPLFVTCEFSFAISRADLPNSPIRSRWTGTAPPMDCTTPDHQPSRGPPRSFPPLLLEQSPSTLAPQERHRSCGKITQSPDHPTRGFPQHGQPNATTDQANADASESRAKSSQNRASFRGRSAAINTADNPVNRALRCRLTKLRHLWWQSFLVMEQPTAL